VNRLTCPFCGARELAEFAFRKTLPEAGASEFAAVYERANRIDDSLEHWQHTQGCRAWLLVRRNPSTGEVREVHLLGGSQA
jgi:heterotetrameric sarcosine oxidase delta subunit